MTQKRTQAEMLQRAIAAAHFSHGDVVQLQSGGPDMFVQHVDHNTPAIMCCWRDADGVKRLHSFSPATLTRVGRSLRQ